MNSEALRHMANLLRELRAGDTLGMPNAWDAAIKPALEVLAMTAPPHRPTLVEGRFNSSTWQRHTVVQGSQQTIDHRPRSHCP